MVVVSNIVVRRRDNIFAYSFYLFFIADKGSQFFGFSTILTMKNRTLYGKIEKSEPFFECYIVNSEYEYGYLYGYKTRMFGVYCVVVLGC